MRLPSQLFLGFFFLGRLRLQFNDVNGLEHRHTDVLCPTAGYFPPLLLRRT